MIGYNNAIGGEQGPGGHRPVRRRWPLEDQGLRTRLLRRQSVLNKVIGTVLVGLGMALALTPSVQ
ncbi:hypothetical protein ABT187_10870 [Streptomyces sp. NPDC001817]|uniref:hypothetical protein n=1 Tax=Streptomyces sp. NPDC001817 TaxID=3154398 RepID=UPI003329EE72